MNHFGWSPGMTLEEVERESILAALRHYSGNKTATASSLGISIRTLDSRLQQYEENAKEHKRKAEEKAQRDADFLKRCRGETAGGTSGAKAPAADGEDGGSALGVESPPRIPPRQAVQVQERESVSGVLPRTAASQGSRRHR